MEPCNVVRVAVLFRFLRSTSCACGQGARTQRYYVDGGFAQVRANVVTVLTGKAVPASEISAEAAARALETALKPATCDQLDVQLKQQERARAQMRVARHVGGEPLAHHS